MRRSTNGWPNSVIRDGQDELGVAALRVVEVLRDDVTFPGYLSLAN
jgi:hypothetical protein